MNFYELAKKILCGIIAVALSMTVSAVESLLPQRPDWLERVEHLALQMRSIASGRARHDDRSGTGRSGARTGMAEAPADPEPESEDNSRLSAEHLLRAYDELWRFVQELRSEGLSLDDEFCRRIEKEWSVQTLLAYMRSSDKSLRERANNAMQSGAAHMFPPEAPNPGTG